MSQNKSGLNQLSVFNSTYAGQYDHLYAEKNYQSECNLIESAFRRHSHVPPRTLLDVGCGTGGHALELAQRGYKVTGVDLSSAMLQQAAHKSEASGLTPDQRPAWICGNIGNFDAANEFDAAIMMFAVVGYLTDNQEVLTGLKNIRRQLKSAALMVCDFWYGPAVLAKRPGDRVRVQATKEGRVIRAATTILDIPQHTAEVTFRLWSIHGDRIVGESTEMHRTRYYFPQEFAFFLSQAGFALQSLSAFPSLDAPLSDETWNAFAIAKAV